MSNLEDSTQSVVNRENISHEEYGQTLESKIPAFVGDLTDVGCVEIISQAMESIIISSTNEEFRKKCLDILEVNLFSFLLNIEFIQITSYCNWTVSNSTEYHKPLFPSWFQMDNTDEIEQIVSSKLTEKLLPPYPVKGNKSWRALKRSDTDLNSPSSTCPKIIKLEEIEEPYPTNITIDIDEQASTQDLTESQLWPNSDSPEAANMCSTESQQIEELLVEETEERQFHNIYAPPCSKTQIENSQLEEAEKRQFDTIYVPPCSQNQDCDIDIPFLTIPEIDSSSPVHSASNSLYTSHISEKEILRSDLASADLNCEAIVGEIDNILKEETSEDKENEPADNDSTDIKCSLVRDLKNYLSQIWP